MILERGPQLEQLRGLLSEVPTDGGRVVLLRGEAGIGKSALVAEFISSVSDGAHVLLGTCDDLLTPQPLGPVWDISRQEPHLSGPLTRGDRRETMELLFDLLARQLRPTVLVLEDTQWADEATLDVIKFLGRRIKRSNGLLLVTYRDAAVDTDHPLRRVIGDLHPGSLSRIRLERLSHESVAVMIGEKHFDPEEVMSLTRGNPLFVTEVLASARDTVPSSVRDAVVARAARLSAPARELLDLVSVVPGALERGLIETVIGATEEHIDECRRQGLLVARSDEVHFQHELQRRAVESSLTGSDRRRLNARVLEALGERANPSRLVHHATQAEDVAAIVKYAPMAARSAMAIESHREAAAHYRALAPHIDRMNEMDRAGLLVDWARAEFYLDNLDSADILDRAIELHRSQGDELALARAITFAVRVNEINFRPEAAEAYAAEAVAILGRREPTKDLAFAVSQRAWLHLMRGDHAMAVEMADRALELADGVHDELTAIHALNTRGTARYAVGDRGGLTLLEEARKRAQAGGFGFEEVRALVNMTASTLEHREVDAASDLAQRALETARRYDMRVLEMYVHAHIAELRSWQGDWSGAEDTVAGILLGSHPHTEVIALWVLGPLQARRGRPEARDTLERAWDLATASGEIQNQAPVAAGLAEFLWLTGEEDQELLDRLGALLVEALQTNERWRSGALAFWLWKLGSLEVVPDSIADPYRLMMRGQASEAAARWEAKGMPYEQALALADGARAERLAALEQLETLGATVVAAKLRRSLRQDGVHVTRGRGRQTREHAASLTARQAEVLGLLAAGLTNVEIADQLFISHRTVENHVSAILLKLDVSAREAAVAAARELGILQNSPQLAS